MVFRGHRLFCPDLFQKEKKKKKGISENISYLFKGQQKGYFLHKVVAMPNFKSGF